MGNFSIGLSGLNAAMKAFDVIGNNIVNAATEGYHRQRIDLAPVDSKQKGTLLFGGGVSVEGIARIIDSLLEQETIRQQASSSQVSQELITLRTVENALGELSTEGGGLNTAIDKFFNALQDLSVHPSDAIWQNQVIREAKTLASRFRTLGEFLTSLETWIKLEAENTVESINTLTSQIAELNNKIERLEIMGMGQANDLRDQRDRCITELSELIGIETLSRKFGVVDVNIGGIPLVIGTISTDLESGWDENAKLGISIAGESSYTTNIQGGKIGGLLSLKNELIYDVHSKLDSLASAIIQQINQYHVQGVGSEGSFTTLTGWVMQSEVLADFETPITSGSVFIRVTDTTVPGTTTISRYEIDIANDLPANPTLSDFADYITNNITGLTASVNSSNQLTITAGTNYKFDFLPAVLPEPKTADISFNGSSDPTVSVSGIYTGTSNDTLTFTVSNAGAGPATGLIGVKDSLTLTVTDGDGDTVATLNIGSGYAAGDKIEVGNTGIKISLDNPSVGTADLANGDYFKMNVFGDTDTAGVLAAAGINTFFSGNDASNIAVCSEISASPGRIATALGADMTDNTNTLRMAEIKDDTISSLSNLTCGEFYRQLATNIGQQISVKKVRQDNFEVILQNLANQKSAISGVDINEEAAQLLVFEQMFQAVAKYIGTIQSSLSSLMEII